MQSDGIAGPLIILLFSIASSSCRRPSQTWEQQDPVFQKTKGSLYLSAADGNGCMHLLVIVHFMKAE